MANEQMSLDDILDDKPEPAEKVEKPEPAEKVEKAEAVEKPDHSADYKGTRAKHMAKEYEAQGRDPETGQFVSKAEDKVEAKAEPKVEAKAEAKVEPKVDAKAKEVAPPKQEFTEKERAFLKGLEEERRKRQAMERELADLKTKTATPQEQPKGFWDDPEGALKRHQEEVRQAQVVTKLQTAEMIARSRYGDFEEKLVEFQDLVSKNPGLYPQMMNAQDPAEFAYKTAKNAMELKEVGNLEEYRAKIMRDTEAEVRKKIEAELTAKADAARKEREALVPSLSEVAASVAPKRAVWTGPTPLDEILK